MNTDTLLERDLLAENENVEEAPTKIKFLTPMQTSLLEGQIMDAIKTVFDPEIPVNIYELGLIYDVTVTERGIARIRMTLTSPACPAAQSLPGEVESKTKAIDGIEDVLIDVVWDPPWTMDLMSEEAQLELGLM